jgi:hypothetical protein
LLRFARGPAPHDLFASQREQAMRDAIAEVSAALKTLNKPSPWSDEIKASDEFLAPLFTAYYQKLGRPNIMAKQRFHELVDFIEPEDVDAEICEKLNAIVEVARQAKPL